MYLCYFSMYFSRAHVLRIVSRFHPMLKGSPRRVCDRGIASANQISTDSHVINIIMRVLANQITPFFLEFYHINLHNLSNVWQCFQNIDTIFPILNFNFRKIGFEFYKNQI